MFVKAALQVHVVHREHQRGPAQAQLADHRVAILHSLRQLIHKAPKAELFGV